MSVNKVNKSTGGLIPIAGQNMYAFAPIGTIVPFGGTTAPQGWLICNGAALSRTDYADLFAVIGTSFGSGNGSTTFNLPTLTQLKQDYTVKTQVDTWTDNLEDGSRSHTFIIDNDGSYYFEIVLSNASVGKSSNNISITIGGNLVSTWGYVGAGAHLANKTVFLKKGSYVITHICETSGIAGTAVVTVYSTRNEPVGRYIIKATTEVVTDNSGKVNVSKMQSGTITIPTGSVGDVISIPVSFGESFSDNNYVVELFNEGTAIVCNPSTKTTTGFEAHVRYMTDVSSSYNIKYNAFQAYTDTTLKTVEALSPYSLNKSLNMSQFNRKFVTQGNSVSATMPHSGRLTLRLIKHGDGYSLYLKNQNNVMLDSYDNFLGSDDHGTEVQDTSITLQAWVKKNDVITLESNLPSNTDWADTFFLQTGLLLYNKDYD